jgi:hypothetical protein
MANTTIPSELIADGITTIQSLPDDWVATPEG